MKEVQSLGCRVSCILSSMEVNCTNLTQQAEAREKESQYFKWSTSTVAQLQQPPTFAATPMEPPPQLHNITDILSPYPELSLFSHYLTLTGIAAAVNGRLGKTVCVVENSEMERLLSHNPSLSTLQNILSFHIFHEFYTAADLRLCVDAITCTWNSDHRTISARSPYERVEFHLTATGQIRLTVPFAGGGYSEFRKQIELVKKTRLSVIQIRNLLPTLDILSPLPPPAAMEAEDLIRTIYSHGGRSYAAALASFPQAMEAMRNSLRSSQGLTLLCPIDKFFESSEYFRTDLGMSSREDQITMLLYHAVPSYQSMEMQQSARRVETLAVRGGRRLSFGVEMVDSEREMVVKTAVVYGGGDWEIRITGMVVDEKPLAIYAIEGVLLPYMN